MTLLLERSARLLIGVVLYGVSLALMIRADIGVGPWDVLSQGLALRTGLTFGTVTFLTSLVVLLLWIPLKQRPGVGTVVNALLMGPVVDLALAVVPVQEEWWSQGLIFAGGLLLLAVASGLYLGAGLGPGPRDGLMTGLHQRFGWRIGRVRTGIELSVLLAGWLLGGQVGVGTAAEAFLIGPLVAVTIPLLRMRRGAPPRQVSPDAERGSAPAS